ALIGPEQTTSFTGGYDFAICIYLARYFLWTIYYNFVILFIGATKTVGGYPSSEGAIPSTQIRNPFGNQSKGG
ncbi:hypothetical protein, partial [Megasphaera sp.]|uniref:hypothetical protein n=1 Tax=Megasphaera sp. TaxID=2023260 RepID=UPI003FF08AAF